MIDWPWLAFLFGYTGIAVIALYLQYKSNIAALDRLSSEHERHTADLRMMVEVLQMALMFKEETKTARPNRATHAELEL